MVGAQAPRIFIVDPNGIFRLGMIACLSSLPGIAAVDGCGTLAEAWSQPALAVADLVIVDLDVGQISIAIGQLNHRVGASVMATAPRWDREAVLEAVEAGAVGVLCKEGMSAESLGLQVRAALHGAGIVPPQLLTSLADHRGWHSGLRADDPEAGLTTREQRVLRLIADGKLTREVAHELSYSERTVKTVLRDATVKLGARSRSQAIAYAVREGLI